jgi:DNA-binding transcriptional ArsR family regulator
MVVMPSQEPLPVRIVQDVETIKALSDPVRVAILRVLMDDAHETPRVLAVKELAEELGEPQTKLYRHVKQLQERGLIRVAETRMVSGIQEHRYQAAQRSLDMDPRFFGPGVVGTDEAAAAFAAILDNYRNDFVAAIRAGLVRFGDNHPPAESYRNAVSAMCVTTIPVARAVEFRDRLAALVDDITATDHDPDGVPIRFLAAFYSDVSHPVEPASNS